MKSCKICLKQFNKENGLTNHLKNCEKTYHLKNEIIDMHVNNLLSIEEISKKIKVSKNKISEYLGEFRRNRSESNVVAHKRFPENFVISDDTKKKMSESHIKWMKENPEKTAWRLANLSYPEKLFLNKIKELKWQDKYLIEREKPIYPFYIDFAFNNEKVAVEIDGSQHLEEDRKQRDEDKDKLLKNNGWSVIRISENEIKNNIDECMSLLNNILNKKLVVSNLRVGIIKEKINKNKYKDREDYFINVRNNYKEKIKPIIEKIEKSNIDFSKQGWVKKVSIIIGCCDNFGGKWMKKHMTSFYNDNCWKRIKVL